VVSVVDAFRTYSVSPKVTKSLAVGLIVGVFLIAIAVYIISLGL
jgi:hypothetical protein